MANNMATTSLLFLALLSLSASLATAHNISAVFAFGDSTLDPGNNNGLSHTLSRADHRPYGRDFPGGIPTGRFSDGKLITDFLVSNLGLKDSLPAYLDPKLADKDLPTGVSFASAGAGLDDQTSNDAGVYTVGRQVGFFEEYLGKLRKTVGEEEANRTVADAVFVIGAGSNDMMMNYYVIPTTKALFSLESYHGLLLNKLQALVEQLYNLGARKFTISGLPALGCLPFTMFTGALTSGGSSMLQRECVEQQNADSAMYNARLQQLLATMHANLPGTRMAYIDIYNPLMDMIRNPYKHGFEVATQGCCGSGTIEMGSLCSDPVPVCPDPSRFVFWDAVHPSQATYRALADGFLTTVLPQLLD